MSWLVCKLGFSWWPFCACWLLVQPLFQWHKGKCHVAKLWVTWPHASPMCYMVEPRFLHSAAMGSGTSMAWLRPNQIAKLFATASRTLLGTVASPTLTSISTLLLTFPRTVGLTFPTRSAPTQTAPGTCYNVIIIVYAQISILLKLSWFFFLGLTSGTKT